MAANLPLRCSVTQPDAPLSRAKQDGGVSATTAWPRSARDLETAQVRLAEATPPPCPLPDHAVVAGVWFAAPTGSPGIAAGGPAWAAAVAVRGGRAIDEAVVRGRTGAGYRAGYQALREGALLERAARRLAHPPDVVLVNATGRDHPRRAGLALHLGAILGVPSIGVTDRPLLATGAPPRDDPDATSTLAIDDDVVAVWLRARAGARPVVVHPGWRTDLATALAVTRSVPGARSRTPEPLRLARRAARLARARDEGRIGGRP